MRSLRLAVSEALDSAAQKVERFFEGAIDGKGDEGKSLMTSDRKPRTVYGSDTAAVPASPKPGTTKPGIVSASVPTQQTASDTIKIAKQLANKTGNVEAQLEAMHLNYKGSHDRTYGTFDKDRGNSPSPVHSAQTLSYQPVNDVGAPPAPVVSM